MTVANGGCLYLSFAEDPHTVRLRCEPDQAAELRVLATKFASNHQISPTAADIPIDELLTGVTFLRDWPQPTAVVWDPSLATLVRDSLDDARVVSDELNSRAGELSGLRDESIELSSDWIADLTSFQRRDLGRLLTLKHGANFSVPGAGKTRVSLALFDVLRARSEVEKLLVVGPKSSFEAWREESASCFKTPLRMDVIEKSASEESKALLVNYERLSGLTGVLAEWLSSGPSMLILDEAHRMKLGASGVYGTACLSLGPRARRRLILTGTPAPNGSRDLESLFGFVWPGQGRRKVVQAVGGGDLKRASEILRPLFTRTTKNELGLPPVTTTIRRLKLPPLHQEVYDALIGSFSARVAGAEEDFQALGRVLAYMMMAATSPALVTTGSTKHEPLEYRVPPLEPPSGSALMTLMQDLPSYEMSPKYQEVIAIVSRNAAAGRKTLIWSTFIKSIKTIAEMLGKYAPAVVHGGTIDRDEQLKRFRTDPSCMALISNPATLGEGISLHHDCHDAVFVDRDFAAGRYLQSLDRIHRLGLAPDVETNVTVLSSVGTIDEVIEQRLALKLEFMGSILDDTSVRALADLSDEEEMGSGLELADLRAIMGHLRAGAA